MHLTQERKLQEKRIRETSCKKCGSDSWISNGENRWRCSPCMVSQRKSRYSRNKEQILSKNKEWAIKNPDKVKEIQKRDRDKNKERGREAKLRWKEANPGKTAEYCANRRAQKKKASPLWMDRKEIQYIYKLAKEKGLVVDHIVPLNSDKVCGLHTQDNLRCITSELNTIKSNKYWSDM